MSRRDEILVQVRKVEAMPSAIQQSLALLRQPDADMGTLARIIEFDPGLTANILHLANSAYFGGARAISSVREAVLRLGVEQVFQLLIAAVAAPRLRQEIKGYGLPAGRLLAHSVTTAVAAEAVGRQLGLAIPECTFTAGLLSNVGKVVLGTFLEVDPRPILDLAEAEELTFEQAEQVMLGISHDEVGAALLEHWGLPGPLVYVVRWRLTPDEAPSADRALDLVHAGGVLAAMTGIGLGLDGLNYRPSRAVAERLGLTQAGVDAALAATLDSLAEVRELFR